jgi:hypothetical protein
MLRAVTPAEALKIVSELTEFAFKISEAAKSYTEEKDH